MKKRSRFLALFLTGALLAGCGTTGSTTGNTTVNEPEASVSADASSEVPAVSADNAGDVEARIKEVGESYDGLYEYDYSEDIAFNTMGGIQGGAMKDELAGATAESATSSTEQPAPDFSYIPWNTENYNMINESGFVTVSAMPFSTFGADVDTAVYSNFRRSIFANDGFGISGEAIRAEEMINYFNYDYPEVPDKETFGVTTSLTDCPWNPDTLLLRIGVKAKEVVPENGSNIVFLIDTSGSMFDNNKLPLVQESLKLLQEQLTDKDTVSIVTYAGSEEVLLEGVKGSEHSKITEAIDSLIASGATNGESGINKAYEIAEEYFIEGGNNRVILCTDGDLNVGVSSEAGLTKLIEEKKETGVYLSCLGFGEGNYQDDKMEALADHGNGNYSFIDCTREAKRVLKDEIWSTLYTVAKDVKFQVEFNPAQVKGYRLIGYENREMAAEDFADDTKDGGEVGSGQTVTVLYEVVTNDSAYKIPETDSRYNTGSAEDSTNGECGTGCCGKSGEECTCSADSPCKKSNKTEEEASALTNELLAVNIRYKEPDTDESTLSVYPVTMDMYGEMDYDTSWAAGVAQTAMLLRGSEYAGTSSYEDIRARLTSDPGVMTDDFKAEFLYMLDKIMEQQD